MIADDQTVVREGLQMVLDVIPELEVVATVADGEQALAAVAEHQPDAILLDLHMPVLDGVGATERLTREHPDVAIVVLTTYADDETIIAALRAGRPRLPDQERRPARDLPCAAQRRRGPHDPPTRGHGDAARRRRLRPASQAADPGANCPTI